MKKGFNSIHAAAGMKNYLERKVKSEIERTKPGPRDASVISIDRANKRCEVQYPGEEGTVRVPYGSVEPASDGARVRIDGPVGSRRIVEVYGKTETQARVEQIEARETSSPLWGMSTGDWAESFPLMMINVESTWPTTTGQWEGHCSPLVIPRAMHIARIEAKVREQATEKLYSSQVGLALYYVDREKREEIERDDGTIELGDITFDMEFIEASPPMSGTVEDQDWRISHKLRTPVAAEAGDIFVVGVHAWNDDHRVPEQYPTFERLKHPTVPLAYGQHQFMRGAYPDLLFGRDVPRSALHTTYLNETLWVAAFPENLPGDEDDGIESGGPESTQEELE